METRTEVLAQKWQDRVQEDQESRGQSPKGLRTELGRTQELRTESGRTRRTEDRVWKTGMTKSGGLGQRQGGPGGLRMRRDKIEGKSDKSQIFYLGQVFRRSCVKPDKSGELIVLPLYQWINHTPLPPPPRDI